jgi:hypothetical protein
MDTATKTALYLTGPKDPGDFQRPAPFVPGLPDEPYAKDDVQAYLRKDPREMPSDA